MIPHNLPPIPGKLYQFVTSSGIVRFRAVSCWHDGPYLVYPCNVVSGRENLDHYNWHSLNIYSQYPGWITVEIDDSDDGQPEYQYTPCNEV